MKFKLVYLNILFLFINYHVKAQIDTISISQNILYFEVGGIAGFWSLNYEKIILNKENFKISGRIGISTYNIKDYTDSFNPDIIIPIAINGLYGKTHKIEIGIGQTISNIVQSKHSSSLPYRNTKLHANFTIGYRYQKNNGGIIYRFGYMPIIEFNKSYRNWLGTSFGFAF